MDGRYSIGTNNRYALFLGEEESADPQDIRKLVQAEKAKKLVKPPVAILKETKSNIKEVKEPIEKKDVLSKKPASNGPSPGDMEKVKNRRNREDKPANDTKLRNGDARPRRDENAVRGPRRDGDGDRPPRREPRQGADPDVEARSDRRTALNKPRPRQNSPSNRRKRDFDRKSGSDKTGVKPVDKREGGGAHNWGTHKDDIVAAGTLNATDVDENDAALTKPNPDPEVINEPPEEVEEEVQELTLDEYRALRGKRAQPQFNLRQAGEGEDPTQWKGLIEMKKKKDTTDSENDEELENSEFPQRVGRQKHLLDIDITFKDTSRGPRARAAPRSPRSKTERPENKPSAGTRKPGIREQTETGKGRNNEGAAPRVDDEKAFPSLG